MLHNIMFFSVLEQIKRKKWSDFDYHRNSFTSTLYMLKLIKWAEVDEEKYDKIFNKVEEDTLKEDTLKEDTFLLLRSSSRYGHYSLKKCFPTAKTCHECFKYFCSCCGQGTNCLYGEKHNNRRCSSIIEKYYSDIYNIQSKPKRVFLYDIPDFDFIDKKSVLCSKDIYGYE